MSVAPFGAGRGRGEGSGVVGGEGHAGALERAAVDDELVRHADRRQHLKTSEPPAKPIPPDVDMADPQADNLPPAKPFDQIEWDKRTAEITDDSGKVLAVIYIDKASPFECREDLEFRSRRADSQALAARTTERQRIFFSVRVALSI